MSYTPSFSKGFASDNWSGVSPEIMEALIRINQQHHPAYGEDDPLEQYVQQLFQQHFGEDSRSYFVWNGTGANVLAIRQLLRPWESVITPHSAHLNVDEAGAPENIGRIKLQTVYCPDGKIYPQQINPFLNSRGFQHHVQPKLISISQTTELGGVYTLDEIRALAGFAHQHQMYLHMDGARIANAAVALNCSFTELVRDTGVDVLSFGGTKNGLMMGEAVVFTNSRLAEGFEYNRKQGMQLASKMRFILAQFQAYIEQEVWKNNAMHANRMAKLLGERLSTVKGIRLSREVEANAVFAIMPEKLIQPLQKHYFFHVWDEESMEVRLMCSFDTEEKDVEKFVYLAQELIQSIKS
ncbi:MAG: low specificity L-threonine aldolase [Bacteroidales bacterium]|jgi:threonine aldolase|nr:low specificity L-threonine aldolase [Bacteroidales bacterium]MDD3702509.1 low specificity L-threonine aldolase [Bacteroidales bacterium]MDY0369574.1 low specificity L-threonine aldolase [Bacteroidales bacterium]